MPSEKSLRVTQKKTSQNKRPRGAARTAVVAARRAIGSGNVEEAAVAISKAASVLDRAAKQGAIHRNNAARRKARLAKRLNALNN